MDCGDNYNCIFEAPGLFSIWTFWIFFKSDKLIIFHLFVNYSKLFTFSTLRNLLVTLIIKARNYATRKVPHHHAIFTRQDVPACQDPTLPEICFLSSLLVALCRPSEPSHNTADCHQGARMC